MRTFFAGLRIRSFPVHFQFAEKVFTTQCEVHRALTFQTGITLIGTTGLGFVDYFVFVRSLVVPLIGVAVAVLPVVTVVEDTFKVYAMVGVDFPVKSQRIALTLASDVILAYFVFVEYHIAVVVLLVSHLHVVATGRIVLIGS